MKMERKSIVRLTSLMLCSYAFFACAPQQQPQANNEYASFTVALSDKSLTSNYTATITGSQSVEIRPQISGMITDVSISEGAVVKKGQTLFVIDQTPYKAELQKAVANVESARANIATAQLTADSKQELFNANVVSDFDLQTAKNALQVAKATLSQAVAAETIARNNLSYTVIKSPVTGATSMTSYRVGSLVTPSIATPLVTVSNDKEMYAYFSMTENQILALSRQNGTLTNAREAMPQVSLCLSDGTMYDHKGTIDAISGVVDSSTGAIAVRAVFTNEGGILRSGASGTIVFPYDKTDCIAIPQAATYEIQDKVFVYRIVDNKTVSTPVTVFAINDGKEYIVESGLSVGDVIIATGAGLVREGTQVTVVNQKQ